MMIDSNSIKIKAHRANIERYRKLLIGRLTQIERDYVMRRIAEERAEIRRLQGCEPKISALFQPKPIRTARGENHAAALLWEPRL